jgi:dTDP-D-glucose 4,6-dehydratase
MRVLITGAAGFVGRHVVEYFLQHTDDEIVVLDSLTYAGNLNRIANLPSYDPKRVKFVYHNLRSPINDLVKGYLGEIDHIYHLAANSSVEFTLLNPEITVMDNVMATVNILEYARHSDVEAINYFSCYDEKTRAFTKEGFKKYSELTVGDSVLTLNKNGFVEEQPIEKILIQDYSGEMVVSDNGQFNFCVTPNHRMYLSDGSVVDAESLVGSQFKPQRPVGVCGVREDIFIDKKPVDTLGLFYLCGVFIGDGFISHQIRVSDTLSGLDREKYLKQGRDKESGQFISIKSGENHKSKQNSYRIFFDIPEKDKARERTEKTLQELGIKYSKHKGKSGEHLYFSSKAWCEFFSQFGRGARNKHIPDWMLKFDTTHLEALYDGLIDSDGYRPNSGKSEVYNTISDRLIENLVELSVKLGRSPSVFSRYNESFIDGRKICGLSKFVVISQGERGTKRISLKQYSGKIWCITVKNKNLLVEREGRLMFCGNTDEVYGPVKNPGEGFDEEAPHRPSNPYSAGKAAGEDYAHAWYVTYGLPVYTTNCMNIFGFDQHPEKYIPTVIRCVKNGTELPVYSSKNGKVAGSRYWIFGYDVASALLFLRDKALPGQKYHIVGEWMDNLDLAKRIAEKMGKPLYYKMYDFHSSRPGHDLHYGLKDTKLGKMGWRREYGIDKGLEMILSKESY